MRALIALLSTALLISPVLLTSCDFDDGVDERSRADSTQFEKDTIEAVVPDTTPKPREKSKAPAETKFEFRGTWESSEAQTRLVFTLNKELIEGFCETERSSQVEYLRGELAADSSCLIIFTDGYGKPTGYKIKGKIHSKHFSGTLYTFEGDEGISFEFEKVDPRNPPVFVGDGDPIL